MKNVKIGSKVVIRGVVHLVVRVKKDTEIFYAASFSDEHGISMTPTFKCLSFHDCYELIED